MAAGYKVEHAMPERQGRIVLPGGDHPTTAGTEQASSPGNIRRPRFSSDQVQWPASKARQDLAAAGVQVQGRRHRGHPGGN
jgi:hypothetical protein